MNFSYNAIRMFVLYDMWATILTIKLLEFKLLTWFLLNNLLILTCSAFLCVLCLFIFNLAVALPTSDLIVYWHYRNWWWQCNLNVILLKKMTKQYHIRWFYILIVYNIFCFTHSNSKYLQLLKQSLKYLSCDYGLSLLFYRLKYNDIPINHLVYCCRNPNKVDITIY